MKITLSEYNPEWPVLFEKEKEQVIKVLSDIPHQIHHTGSTSIPGLGAKPVIDILLGINSYSGLKDIIPILTQIGFEYRNLEHFIPQWAYFTRPQPFRCHIHCVEITSDFYKRQITFRDYLRTHDDKRDKYYILKKELAEIEWEYPMDYSFAKDDFIRNTEKEAYNFILKKIEIAEALALEDIYCNSPSDLQNELNISFKNYGPGIISCELSEQTGRSIGVLNLGIFEEVKEDFIDFIINYNKSIKGGEFRLNIPGIAGPDKLDEILLKKGFKPKGCINKFYRSTYSVKDTGLSHDIRELCKEQAEVFDDIISPEKRKIFTHIIGKPEWHTYAVYENNIPISAASMYMHEDTAWLGFAATLPDHRNKGAQSALLVKRMIEAKKLNCNWITAATHGDNTNSSYKNLTRLGFTVLYTCPFYYYAF